MESNGKKVKIGEYEIEFPYEPYRSQVLFMSKVIETLCHPIGTQCHALLESPTGTGKSLSLLCSSLCWQESLKVKMIQQWRNWYEEFKKENGDEFLKLKHDDMRDCNQSDNEEGIHHYAKRLRISKNHEIVLGSQQIPLPINLSKTEKEREASHYQLAELSKIVHLIRNGFHHKAEQRILNSAILQKDNKQKKDASSFPKIYFGTRTHSQIKQLIREFRKTSYRPRMVVLGSKDHYCIHPEVSLSTKKNEDCKKLIDTLSCQYFKQYARLAECNEILPGGKLEVFDIEDLVTLGNSMRSCPYFATHDILEKAEIVFCPYNYLIDPIIRDSMHIEFTNSVVIIDEAHNIEDVCRDAASGTLSFNDLIEITEEMLKLINDNEKPNLHSKMNQFLNRLITWIRNQENRMTKVEFDTKSYTLRSRSGIIDMFHQFGFDLSSNNGIQQFRSMHQIFEEILHHANHANQKQNGTHVLSVKAQKNLEIIFYTFDFMLRNNLRYLNDYVISLTEKNNTINRESRFKRSNSYYNATNDIMISFWCMNPAAAFEELKVKCHSVILTSGTLSPMSSFSSELGTEFKVVFEAPHVVDLQKQIWIGQISIGPENIRMNASYNEASSPAFQDALGRLILDYCKIINYGVLVFFPSYNLMGKLEERWKSTNLLKELKFIKNIFMEPRTNFIEGNFADKMEKYYTSIKKIEKNKQDNKNCNGSLFLAVCRGKVSEGIDLKDNFCRAVIVVGIPFPNIKELIIKEKRRYNDEKALTGTSFINGQSWYCQQAYRAVNQAIGRCLRHKYDYGAIILVDERYKDQKIINNLSKWIRHFVNNFSNYQESLNSLKQFFSNIKENPIVAPSIAERPDAVNRQSKRNILSFIQVNENTDNNQTASSSNTIIQEDENDIAVQQTQLPPVTQPIISTFMETNNDMGMNLTQEMTQIVHVDEIRLNNSLKQEEDGQNSIKNELPSLKLFMKAPWRRLVNSSREGAKVLLKCIRCNMTLLEQKAEFSETELVLKRDLQLPSLNAIRLATQYHTSSANNHKALNLYQIPAAFKNRPCPFRIFVTKYVASIDTSIEDTISVNNISLPLRSYNAKKDAKGYVINTVWSDEDGMTYELLFCRSCKQCVSGVFVKSADATKLNHINEVFLFVENTRRIHHSGTGTSDIKSEEKEEEENRSQQFEQSDESFSQIHQPSIPTQHLQYDSFQ